MEGSIDPPRAPLPQRQYSAVAESSSTFQIGVAAAEDLACCEERTRLERYKFGSRIGKGEFAKVVIGEHRLTGQKVAAKILDRAEMRRRRMTEKVEREIKIMRLLKHPHVIRFYEAIETEKHTYIIMELAGSGQLYDYVSAGKLHEAEARRIFQQIASGVAYCHRNMVVHHDLKMENILLNSQNDVKIADFGLSNFFRYNQYLTTGCGSPHYLSPELIEGRSYVGPEVDCWSCGVILFGLLCGFLPFDGHNRSALYRRIRSGKFEIPTGLSSDASDLICSMLVVNREKRSTIAEVLEHPWLQASLPRYLSIPPLDGLQQIKMIDDETMQVVVQMGFDKKSLVESLLRGEETEATVVYNLIFDKRVDARSRYLWMACQGTTARSIGQMDAYDRPSTAVAQFAPEWKWTLGFEFHDSPRTIMHKVTKALQELDVFTTNCGYYKMKCAWFPGVPGASVEGMLREFLARSRRSDAGGTSSNPHIGGDISHKLSGGVLFEIQLYKAGEGNYLLDLTRISGPQLRYLHLCSQLHSQLRIA